MQGRSDLLRCSLSYRNAILFLDRTISLLAVENAPHFDRIGFQFRLYRKDWIVHGITWFGSQESSDRHRSPGLSCCVILHILRIKMNSDYTDVVCDSVTSQ